MRIEVAEVLRGIRARAMWAGVFVDFDGTLSEIAPTPEAAVPVAGAADALSAVAARVAIVGVVSGRRAEEAAAKLGHPAGVRFFGLYGREEVGEVAETVHDPDLYERLAAMTSDLDGIRLEQKGPHLAVHFRAALRPDETERILRARLAALAAERGLQVLPGKRVLELAPADTVTKGAVIRTHAAGLEAVLYAGDDLSDLDAFAAVAAVHPVVGVRVAVRSAETPAELVEAADLVVEGPEELVGLLDELAWGGVR